MARQALGRGLSALISTPELKEGVEPPPHHSGETAGRLLRNIPIDSIIANPSQPRRVFEEEGLKDLAESIKSVGILQPILVRKVPGTFPDRFEIIAGERRWRASKLAGLPSIPARVEVVEDSKALEIGLIENIQRADLNPIDEASAIKRLIEDFGLSQVEVSERLGRQRSSVANSLRLLSLPSQLVDMISDFRLSVGHAKVILGVKEPSAQISLAKKVLNEGLSVRALESIVARVVVLDSGKRAPIGAKSAVAEDQESSLKLSEYEERLRKQFGTKVSIKNLRSGKGKIEFQYFSQQELDRLLEILAK